MRIRFSRSGFWLPAAGLLALFVLMAVNAAWHLGATYDEPGHVTSGYAAWLLRDYRLDAEGGLLSTRIGSAGLLGMHLTFPETSGINWTGSNATAMGFGFFFDGGNDFDGMLHHARLGVILFTLLPLWLIWQWARHLFGDVAGLLALALAVFSPTLLAHGSLATADMIFTGCLLAALSAWWLLWHRATPLRCGLAAVAAGAALTAKMSGVLLIPMLAVLLAIRLARGTPLVIDLGGRTRWVRKKGARAVALVTLSVIGAVGCVGTVWAVYGFRFSAAPAGSKDLQLEDTWEAVLGQSPIAPAWNVKVDPLRPVSQTHTSPSDPVLRMVGWSRDHRLMPEGFLWGFAFTYGYSQVRASYMLGHVAATGSRLFFPLAFLLKTTPAEFLAFGAGLVGLVLGARALPSRPRFRRLRWLYRSAPLLVMALGYWAVALRTPLGIGHRHVLPVYPAFFVFAGAAALLLQLKFPRRLQLIAGVLLLFQAVDSLVASPFYLSYFTPFVGGMREGWHYLVDSSYDWGQGLPAMKKWLDAKTARGDQTPVFLTYFGTDWPAARHLPVTRFGDMNNHPGGRTYPAAITGGWFAISATHYERVYLNGGRDWLPEGEKQYVSVTGYRQMIDKQPKLMQENMTLALAMMESYEFLQFERLCYFLRNRRPLEVVGGSILIFKLSDEEIRAVLYGPVDGALPPPAP